MQLNNLRIGYDGRAIASVEDVTLTPERIWMVHGPNGVGKTTLLKTLGGLLPTVSGAVTPALRQGRDGAVFVHSVPVLFRGTVRDNLRLTGHGPAVQAVTQAFDLAQWLDVRVQDLSHGLKQRASLARAIATGPTLLLVDEPEGGLDQDASGRWNAFLQSAVADARLTIVIAAHRPAPAGLRSAEIVIKDMRKTSHMKT